MDSAILVRGAREHNLANVDVAVPRGRIVVVCGPSGSGKSSFAFDTLHAEAQRRYVEALGAIRPGVRLRQPAVDAIEGLPPTIALDQRGGGPSARSTVGSTVDALSVLRVLFGRAGTLHCPDCGVPVQARTHDEIAGTLLRRPGERVSLEAPVRGEGQPVLDEVARAGFSRIRLGGEIVRLDEVRADQVRGPIRIVVDRVRVESDKKDRLYDAIRTTTRAGKGIVIAVFDDGEQIYADRPVCTNCGRSLPALDPTLMSWNSRGACATCSGTGKIDGAACTACAGSRLNPEARAVRWAGRTLPDLLGVPIQALIGSLADIDASTLGARALADLIARLQTLLDLGLGQMSLGRDAGTVSSGELQRLRIARQVGAGLTGVAYVLDEPAAGLAPEAAAGVVALLVRLRELGNTVIVVDHHHAVLRVADHIIEFGPGPGALGGRIVYEGGLDGLIRADTATGAWISGRAHLPAPADRPSRGRASLRKVASRGVVLDVDVPLGQLVAIEGPSGSGKTALLDAVRGVLKARLEGEKGLELRSGTIGGLDSITRVVEVDRAPLPRSGRSNPATYVGLWDTMRELLAATAEAKVRGLGAGMFSLAAKGGRCEACQGAGERRIDMGPLPEISVPCDVCNGMRFAGDVLEVTWKGLSPHDLLELTVDEARPRIGGHPKLDEALRALSAVGLGYLRLGQTGGSLSGGEAQRLRLARELVKATRATGQGTLFLLDDPSVGLHPADVAVLHGVLDKLVVEGASVWMATADPLLAASADTIVRL